MKNRFIVLILFLLIPNIAFAQDASTLNEVKDFIADFSAIIIQVAGMVVSWFLSPDWISGDILGINDVLKNIWILVSNFVYLIFAGILIWVSFTNIVGIGGDNYQLKSALPKFIISVLLVPFTWFIVQFVISLSSILTVIAIQFPADIMNSMATDSKTPLNKVLTEHSVPTACTVDVNLIGGGLSSNAGTAGDAGKLLDCEGSQTLEQIFDSVGKTGSSSIYGVLGVYTNTIFNVKDYEEIKLAVIDDSTNLISILFGSIVNIIILLALAVLLFALMLALLVRGLRLWLYAALSPLFALFIFFGKTSDGLKQFDFKNLIGLALVPVYVSFALTVGLVLTLLVMSDDTKTGLDSVSGTTCEKDGGFRIAGDTTNNGDVTTYLCYNENKLVTFKGMPFPSSDGDSASGDAGYKNPIGWLLIRIFALVVLWGAVMAALRSSDITKVVVEPFYQMGTNIGKLGTEGFKHVPIMKGLSLSGMQQLSNAPNQMIQEYSANKMHPVKSKMDRMFSNDRKIKAITDFKDSVRNTSLNAKNLKQSTNKLLDVAKASGTGSNDFGKAYDDLAEWFNSSGANVEQKTKWLKEYGIDANALEAKHKEQILAGGDLGLLEQIRSGEFKKADNNLPSAPTKEGYYSEYKGDIKPEGVVTIPESKTGDIFNIIVQKDENSPVKQASVYLSDRYNDNEKITSLDALFKKMGEDDFKSAFEGLGKEDSLNAEHKIEIFEKMVKEISGNNVKEFDYSSSYVRGKLESVGLLDDVARASESK